MITRYSQATLAHFDGDELANELAEKHFTGYRREPCCLGARKKKKETGRNHNAKQDTMRW